MVILENNRLNEDFLRACALPNLRALIGSLFADNGIRSRSRAGLLDQIDVDAEEITPGQLREALWIMMDLDSRGAFHVCILGMGDVSRKEAGELISVQCLNWPITQHPHMMETGSAVDVRERSSDEGSEVEILYLGEAVAEVYDEAKSGTETIDGEEYIVRAYRVTRVPVVSTITISSVTLDVRIVTCPIQRSVSPTSEVIGLRDMLEQRFGLVLPPIGGIAAGIRALWGTTIRPRTYDVDESDGTLAHIRCAPGTQNPRSIDVETRLRDWNLKSGSLIYDGRVSMRVDTGKALFSFGSRVSRREAYETILTILRAA